MVIEVLGGKMDLHMGSHSLPLKFMPCMHHQCPRLFTSSKGPICLLLPFWILPSMACYWGVNGSFATFSFPSHFDQKRKGCINAISVLCLLLYVGRNCIPRFSAISYSTIWAAIVTKVYMVFTCLVRTSVARSFIYTLLQ